MMPSASELTYFIEVASTLNLSRAAERLGLSQPSLTLAIQRLEHAIGTPLLIRSKKGVILTQPGKQLLAHSRSLLQEWETVKSHALVSAIEVQGCYTLGCHVSIALYLVTHFLPDLLEKYPQLEIKLLHDLSRKVTESVIQMQTDIGIVVNPVEHPDLVIRKLFDDEVTCWVGKGTRRVQDFQSGDAVLICDPELIQTRTLLKTLNKNGIHYRRILATSSLEVITQLVEDGAGIGIIPGCVALSHIPKGLRKVPSAPIFYDEICLLFRMENKGVRSLQVISETIVAKIRESEIWKKSVQ